MIRFVLGRLVGVMVLSVLQTIWFLAIAMLFGCGFAFGRCAGLRPWAAGLAMVAVGAILVGVAIALGG